MRSAARTAVITVVAVLAMAASAAASPAPLTPGSRYLALGDSVTFGFQEAQVVPAPNYHTASAFVGYPEQLAAALHVKVANAACPGETSASLIDASAPSNGCEGTAPGAPTGYRKAYPLHVHYRGSQLAYAVSYLRAHNDVRLVTLMIGANDAFLCQATTKDKCGSAAELTAVLAGISKNVGKILSALRNKAHYTGQLVLLKYYSLDYGSAFDNAESQFLNRAETAAAKKYHAVIADAYAELRAASLNFGGHTCTAGLLNVIGQGKCGVHPTYAGQALLAEAVEKTLRT